MLLSLGRLCKQKGYDFKWPAHGDPKLIDPLGNPVALRMKGFVPTVSGASVLFEKSREEAESLVNEFFESVLADFAAHQLRLEMGDARALAGAASGSFSQQPPPATPALPTNLFGRKKPEDPPPKPKATPKREPKGVFVRNSYEGGPEAEAEVATAAGASLEDC